MGPSTMRNFSTKTNTTWRWTKFSQGTYESLGNNHYLLTDQTTGESTLITQGHRGFYYYYAPIDTVLYFTKRAP